MNISIRNASVNINGKSILEYINFDIHENEHIAIVGRNGAGKTTLLKALIDNDLFESGLGDEKFTITHHGKFTIGYMKQIDFEDESCTLLEEVRKSFQDLINMENKINELVLKMNNKSSDELISLYTNTLEQFNLLGGYSYQKEYEVMLHKFGFSELDKNKKISEFSGGQKTKIAFIKLLLSKPDLLILDEPTNHLDIKMIEWLEDYLRKYKKAIIIVSHDRMFIDHIATKIYDIEYGESIKYIGNYESYEKQKHLRYEKALNDYEYQQKEIKRLKAIYERFRFKPTKASLAMSRLHQLERMDILEKPRKEDTRVFQTNLKEIEKSSENVFNIKNATFGYPNKPLFNLNLNITRGMKIGIIGPNGVGKSTILKTLNNIISPLQGKIVYGNNIKIGYFDQTLAMIDSNQSIIDEFRTAIPDLNLEQSRSALGSFLFKGEDVFKPINVLSGGEKVRLQLCKILYNKPNVLILDEPTNHLDIIGKEHLENILKNYEGTIIFVSHDRYFIKKIADHLIVIDEEINYYPYNYEEYLRKNSNKEKNEEKNPLKPNKEQPIVKEKDLEKCLKKIEKEIIKLEENLKELNELMYSKEIYLDVQKSKKINEQIKEIQKKIEEKNNEWEKLANELI